MYQLVKPKPVRPARAKTSASLDQPGKRFRPAGREKVSVNHTDLPSNLGRVGPLSRDVSPKRRYMPACPNVAKWGHPWQLRRSRRKGKNRKKTTSLKARTNSRQRSRNSPF